MSRPAAILRHLPMIILTVGVVSISGCIPGEDADSQKYVYDDDTEKVPREDEQPVEYDTSVNENASFNFKLSGLPFVGVNMSGPEWDGGSSTWPNQYLTKGYESYLKYFRGWGMTTIRLPFKWEYLQPELGGEFDEEQFESLKITVFHSKKYRAKVLIDMHNYARYGGKLIGSDEVSYDDFADAWRRLAETFKPYPEVMFGIMNEPHDMSTAQWVTAANTAIAAIRDTGAENLIFLNANGWSGAHSWTQGWTDLDGELTNAEAMLQIVDPIGDDHLIFEVHQYLNVDSSDWGECECSSFEVGSGCTPETVGSYRMQQFTKWLHDNNKKGFLGEFGSYDDATCMAALDDQLKHMEENDDVYVGWTWWSAGPGCVDWQKPIDPYCWNELRKKDLEENGVDGKEIYGQVKLLTSHIAK
jgi:endoglucanase